MLLTPGEGGGPKGKVLYLNLGPAIPNVFQISVKGFTAKMFSSMFLKIFFFFKEKTLLASGNFSAPTPSVLYLKVTLPALHPWCV